MYVFHKGFDGGFLDLQFVTFSYWVFGYGSSYSSRDGVEGVYFSSIDS